MPLKEYFLILRPANCFIAAIAAWIGYCLALGQITFNESILLAMLPVFIICGAGQTINDYFDVRIDEKKGKKSVLAKKRMPEKNAFYYALILFALGSSIAFFVNYTAFIIAIVFSALLFSYSAFFNKIKFLGNWVVALGTSFTLIFGATLIGRYELPILLAVAALFANVARELTKDIEDLKADTGLKKTLPQIVSVKAVKVLSVLLIAGAIAIGFIPWIKGLFNSPYYLGLMALSSLVFLYSLKLLLFNEYNKGQRLFKAGMALALIAFLFGVV